MELDGSSTPSLVAVRKRDRTQQLIPIDIVNALRRCAAGAALESDYAGLGACFDRLAAHGAVIECSCRSGGRMAPIIERSSVFEERGLDNYSGRSHHLFCPFVRRPRTVRLPGEGAYRAPLPALPSEWRNVSVPLNAGATIRQLEGMLQRLLEEAGTFDLELSTPIYGSGHDYELEVDRLKWAAQRIELEDETVLSDHLCYGTLPGMTGRWPISTRYSDSDGLDAVAISLVVQEVLLGPNIAVGRERVPLANWMSTGPESTAGGPYLAAVLSTGSFAMNLWEHRAATLIPIAYGNRFFPIRTKVERDFLRDLHRCWDSDDALWIGRQGRDTGLTVSSGSQAVDVDVRSTADAADYSIALGGSARQDILSCGELIERLKVASP